MGNFLYDSACKRARQDTRSYFSSVHFWLLELLITAGFTIWVLLWTPPWVKDWVKIVYQVLIPIFGAIAGLGMVFVFSLFRAPYKQRNEARIEIKNLIDKYESSPYPRLIACTPRIQSKPLNVATDSNIATDEIYYAYVEIVNFPFAQSTSMAAKDVYATVDYCDVT